MEPTDYSIAVIAELFYQLWKAPSACVELFTLGNECIQQKCFISQLLTCFHQRQKATTMNDISQSLNPFLVFVQGSFRKSTDLEVIRSVGPQKLIALFLTAFNCLVSI